MDKKPSHFIRIMEKYPRYMKAHEELGKAVKEAGPLDGKTLNLVQLAAAVTAGSEGAVHSHARRARDLGVSEDELCHAILACTSTVGFPAVSAALSWIGHPDEEEES